MKKIIAALITAVVVISSMLVLSSCAEPYNGVNGKNGKDGKNGLTPYIGENGNWWLGDVDSGISVNGEKGEKGDTGDDGDTGADGLDGKNGKDGVTPEFRYNVKTERLEASYDNGKSWVEFNMYPFDNNGGSIGGDDYDYPIGSIQLLDGCIATIDNRYIIADGYYGAIIPLEGLEFNTVIITPSQTTQNLGYAFLDESLVVDRVPNFSEGYYEVVWTDSPAVATISIPEGAKYLYVYYKSDDKIYLPAKVIFANR